MGDLVSTADGPLSLLHQSWFLRFDRHRRLSLPYDRVIMCFRDSLNFLPCVVPVFDGSGAWPTIVPQYHRFRGHLTNTDL